MLRLGVNVDHVATVRQARLASLPDPVEAALWCEAAGAWRLRRNRPVRRGPRSPVRAVAGAAM